MQSSKLSDVLKGRNNNLDIIRLLASILVVLSHSYPLTGRTDEIVSLITKGQWTGGGLAVATFFVISGFLVSRSFEKTNLKQFIKNRALRIFPGLIMAVIITIIVIGPIFTSLSFYDYIRNPATIAYFNNIFLLNIQYNLPGVFESNLYPNAVNGSIWTIPYEVLCYIGVSLMGYYGILRQKKVILLFFIILFSINYIVTPQISSINLNGFLMGSLIELTLFFLMGVLFYVYRESILLNRKYMWVSIVILMVAVLLGNHLKITFLFFGSYLIFYFAYAGRGKFNNINKYGDLSYGIYIYAFPIQQIVQSTLGNQTSPIVNFIYSISAAIVVAFISWHIIEKQALKLKVNKKNFRELSSSINFDEKREL